jgi:4-hydroxy-4-methyl-2-oxoglutarate aldolase
VILADIDGVICVPRDIAHAVLVRAEEIRANEKKIFGWVAEGQTVREITKQGGYF